MILDLARLEDLRNFALCNSRCRHFTDRRLWYTFRIAPRNGEKEYILDCLQALFRLSDRARQVRRLIIGPLTWAWDEDSVAVLPLLWRVVPNLRELLFDPPTALQENLSFGGEFAPVLRSLAQDGAHLRLEVFKHEGWLTSDSPLYDFLNSQPTITRIVGVDVYSANTFVPPTSLLPDLKSLACSSPVTARVFAPARPISSMNIKGVITLEETLSLVSVLSKCDVLLQDARFHLPNHSADPTHAHEALGALYDILSPVKSLAIDGLRVDNEDVDMLNLLPQLEVLEFIEHPVWWDDIGDARPIAWDTLTAPKLRKVLLPRYKGVQWVRQYSKK